jgi:hypothetical protein
MGWACLAAPDETPGGSCEIEASRAFVLAGDFSPGANLIAPDRRVLKPGAEAALQVLR